MQRTDFKTLYCERFACSIQQFERQFLSRSLHRHARPFARLISRLSPAFFHEDCGFIRDLASASSHGEVVMELNRFYGRNVRDDNWFRKTFSLRISGKRVLRLSRKLFRSQEPAHSQARAR